MKTLIIIIGAAACLIWAALALQQFLTNCVMEEFGSEIDGGLRDERGRPLPQDTNDNTPTA